MQTPVAKGVLWGRWVVVQFEFHGPYTALGVSWMILPPASCRPRWCWSTASVYCARFRAPGLYCRVRFPLPARAIASPSRVLQDLQSQRRLSGEPFDSSPSMWSITRKRVEPHKAHLRGDGGQRVWDCECYGLISTVVTDCDATNLLSSSSLTCGGIVNDRSASVACFCTYHCWIYPCGCGHSKMQGQP